MVSHLYIVWDGSLTYLFKDEPGRFNNHSFYARNQGDLVSILNGNPFQVSKDELVFVRLNVITSADSYREKELDKIFQEHGK